MGYDETPLHYACRFGEADIIKLLITKGKADVNAMDKENRTPLFHVVKWRSEIVNILLTNGAKIDVVDNYGNTPLLLAIEKGGSTEVIKLLITKGKADVTAVCKKYRINSKLSRSEIAELLITKIPKLMSVSIEMPEDSV
ncbi:PREDICTED: serine/threonine-protein phosphatase 6 regulatory ankyrin repeat subunit C-like, partial [Amphimedon queenslandica]|uniref:Ankyrin repeat protein n=1 Tax=Amphimedon queenslandica TaxID=400682 RepID=A0AAN0K1J1_AMPQE